LTPRAQNTPPCDRAAPVPARAGIGVKPAHYRDLLTTRPRLAFIEVHTENYMGDGGPPHAYLQALAELYPLSLHGVGLSLGGAEPLDREHLRRWRALVDRYQPALVSEHVAWSRFGGLTLHDLLPIPYTPESLALLCDHVDEMQTALGRRILIENPSSYIAFHDSQIAEADFLTEIARRSGCGLLLDINNVYVSARNHGFDPRRWLARIPGDLVGEIHLAGHSVIRDQDFEIRIDDHGSRVCSDVWNLYSETVARIGARPTLIEWDTDVPELAVLLDEARRADDIAAQGSVSHAAVA
jgi:uncharacterized protein (UPF0276 family)